MKSSAMKNSATKPKAPQATTANRLDTVLGALDKKAPGNAQARGTCTRFIYCF